jgi:hypothetical protein
VGYKNRIQGKGRADREVDAQAQINKRGAKDENKTNTNYYIGMKWACSLVSRVFHVT